MFPYFSTLSVLADSEDLLQTDVLSLLTMLYSMKALWLAEGFCNIKVIYFVLMVVSSFGAET